MDDRNWYARTYRKLFFDFHSAGTAAGLAAAFDADAWAERLLAANAQAVSVFTKCGFGYSFYQKGSLRYQHPHLPAGLDMLAEQIRALHARGLKALGYYHTFNSEPIARDHPDWVERDADGNPRGTSICLLSPLAREWMLPHIAEIVSNYDVDAMFFDGTYAHGPCFCPACQAGFAACHPDLQLPEKPGAPGWDDFVAWKLAALRQLRQEVCDTIHALRPEVVVSVNWAYAPRMPEVVPEGIGALVADIMPDDQVFGGSYLAAYWELLGRPFDIMNSAFLQWWGDWGCKPAVAMQQEVATAVAHGGLTWIGYQMQQDFDVQPAVMEQLGATLAFVKDREELLEGSEAVPYAAVLHGTSRHFSSRGSAFWVRETSLRGAHRALTQSMTPHHLVSEQTLLARLDEFRVLVIPDERYLPPAVVEALEPWVRAGGALVAMGLSGTEDGAGRPQGCLALGDLLGVTLQERYDRSHAYVEIIDERLKAGTLPMPHLAECDFAFVRPSAAEVQTLAKLRRVYLRSDGEYLLRWSPVGEDSGCPAVTLRKVGEGYAAYVAGDICHAYQVKNQWNLKHLLANLLGLMAPEAPVTVAAPAWLEVVLRRQQGRLVVHLVNHHGDHAVDTNFRTVEQVLPVREVTVTVRGNHPSGVTLEPGGLAADWCHADGLTTVRVPEVLIHTAVVVEQ